MSTRRNLTYQNIPGLPAFTSKVATKSLGRPGDEAILQVNEVCVCVRVCVCQKERAVTVSIDGSHELIMQLGGQMMARTCRLNVCNEQSYMHIYMYVGETS